MEEAFLMKNYFKDLKKKTVMTTNAGKKSDGGMSEHLRSYGIQKIFDLH